MRNARFAYLAGPLAFTGVQLVAPTLPLIADDLMLSNSELALVTSVYLFPAALFALPSGMLADRWGRRSVLGWSMILFGLCGGIYVFVADSFIVFLAVRLVQGLAFAAVLPLTITILGDAFRGPALVRAQGYRTVSLGIGEAILPVIGGLLAAVRWEYAWSLQALALPFGIVALLFMEDHAHTRSNTKTLARGRDLSRLLREPSIISLEWVGVQRMFVKFALLAFLPVFLVDVRGYSPEFAGLVIGVAAATGVVVALFAARLTRHGSTIGWVGWGMAAVALSVIGYVTAPAAWIILAISVVHGAADGVTGVLSNSLVAVAARGEMRATFVAATGALRNFAKFLAPTTFGALVLVLPLGTSFVALGAVGTAASVTARLLRPLESRLMEGAQQPT